MIPITCDARLAAALTSGRRAREAACVKGHTTRLLVLAALAVAVSALPASAADWPQWGNTGQRNMVSAERGLPTVMEPGTLGDDEAVDVSTAKNLRWVAKLGSQTYGNPTVSGGRVFVGTNNGSPRDEKISGDYSMVMAFEEATGAFQWQLATPKLGAGKVSDWEFLGICSSPAVETKVAYVVTNRGDVVALDVAGMANKNQGPFKDEPAYVAGAGQPPAELGGADGDILWRFAMREELGVFPHNITSSSVLVHGKYLYVTTSNGVDWSHKNIPAPMAPALVVIDKKKGTLVGEEASGISKRLLHANWSSPTSAKVGTQEMILFGAGDGWLYGFEPKPKKGADGVQVLPELFRVDMNPTEYRVKEDGTPHRYARRHGPSEIIATPVFHDGLVYVAIGQDPEHGTGKGALSAIDPSERGDLTGTDAVVWRFQGIGRSISTVAVSDGIVYAADLAGRVYALDAKTGDLHWEHDTHGHIWGSPLVADGKVYIGNEDGFLTVLAAGKEARVLHTADFKTPIYASAVAANGAVYVATHTHLYAFAEAGTK